MAQATQYARESLGVAVRQDVPAPKNGAAVHTRGWPLYSYGLRSYGLCSYGLYSYDLCSNGQYSCELYSYSPHSYCPV